MEEIEIKQVDMENLDDLCQLCVPIERRGSAIYARAIEGKKTWATEVLKESGTVGKLAYYRSEPAGLLQYEFVRQVNMIRIHCIYVPDGEHWKKGIATQLLSALLDEARGSISWFGGSPPNGIVTRAFPGEKPGQYPAKLFFKRFGFMHVGSDPDQLFLPLKNKIAYTPPEEGSPSYIPQEEDKGKAVMLYSPSFCPFSYVFLRNAEDMIKEVAPEIKIHWIDRSEQPCEFNSRGGFDGCVVNLRPIRSFVLDKDSFKNEVKLALQS